MIQNALQVFRYKKQQVRTTEIDGEVWFVAKDVCDILGIINPSDAVKDFDEDEKGIAKIYTIHGMQGMTVISVAGLYALIIKSGCTTCRRREARQFSWWITHKVLPTIRKTGSYSLSPAREDKELKCKELEIRSNEVNLRRAELIQRILDNPPFPMTPEIKTVFAHEIYRLTSGHECIAMLPECTEKWYTASDIGSVLGLTANKVSRLANKYGIKPPVGEYNEYGRWIFSKSKHSSREVHSFIYSEEGLDWFREHKEGCSS